MGHNYNLFRRQVSGVTFADEAAICPACGNERSLTDLVEELPIDNTDGQVVDYTCVKCEVELRITLMVALWRTSVTRKVCQSQNQSK